MKASNGPRLRLVLPLGLVVLTMIFSLNLTSCTPGSGVSVQESDVVATLFDPKVDFGAIKYYEMPDTIRHITEDPDKDSPLLSREFDEEILALIAANFEARGYVRVDSNSPNEPDVFVLVGATAIQNFALYSGWGWYPYWGWYPGWGCCGPGWGWGYPPATGVTYAFTTGTLFVDMVDPDEADEEDQTVPVYWNGTINGVLDDSKQSKRTRITDSINQMFAQSPYLESR